MTNEQIFTDWCNRHGIVQKAEGELLDLSTVSFGGLLPVPLVENLISLTRNQSAWLSAIDTRVRGRQSGNIPITRLNEPVTEHVGRNDGTKILTTPVTRTVPYNCKKFKSELYITTEELREAVQGGISNFEQTMMNDWTTQLANDVARLVMQSDTDLDSSTRLNRLLNACDGAYKLLRAGANVMDAEGAAFDQGIFAAMLDYMPDEFSEDPGWRWWFNRRVNTNWHNTLTNVNTTERMRSQLGDQALTTEIMVPPLGISQLIVPQIVNTHGVAPAIAPTSAADGGSSNIVFVLTTLITRGDVATVAAGVGRKFIVTYLPTGMSEVITGYDDTTLKAATVGLLGQTTLDTTAANYTVRLYDETELYLGNPKNVVLVYCNEWRTYREFNKDYDRWEVTTYFEADVLVPTPELVVMFERVKVTPITSW